VVAGDLLLVAEADDRALAAVAGQARDAVAHEGAVDAAGGHAQAVVALQVPGDAHRPEVVGAPEVEDLLLDLGRHAQGHVHRAGALVHESGLAELLVAALPDVEALPRDPEAPRREGDVAALLGVAERCQLPLDVTLLLRHPRPLNQRRE